MLSGFHALWAALLLATGPGGDDIYTWTDADGVAHFTNDPNTIPRRYRDKARTLEAEPVPEPAPKPPPPAADSKPAAEEPEAKPRGTASAERAEEPPEESAPPPLPVEGTPRLDEAGWRRIFVRTTERVQRAERTLARDRAALERVSSEEGYLIVDPYGRVMTAGRATALRLQVAEDERVLRDAREALYELERIAAREAVPLEWRR